MNPLKESTLETALKKAALLVSLGLAVLGIAIVLTGCGGDQEPKISAADLPPLTNPDPNSPESFKVVANAEAHILGEWSLPHSLYGDWDISGAFYWYGCGVSGTWAEVIDEGMHKVRLRVTAVVEDNCLDLNKNYECTMSFEEPEHIMERFRCTEL